MRNMLWWEWVSRNEVAWFLLLNPLRASVEPGPVGQGMSKALVCAWAGRFWLQAMLLDWSILGRADPAWGPWDHELRSRSLWLNLPVSWDWSSPPMPGRLRKHFLVRRFRMLGGVMLITCQVLFTECTNCLFIEIFTWMITSPPLPSYTKRAW